MAKKDLELDFFLDGVTEKAADTAVPAAEIIDDLPETEMPETDTDALSEEAGITEETVDMTAAEAETASDAEPDAETVSGTEASEAEEETAPTDEADVQQTEKDKKPKKKKNKLLIVILCILILLLILMFAAGLLYKHYYDKANFETEPESVSIVTDPEVLEEIETVAPSEEAEILDEIEKALEEARKKHKQNDNDDPEEDGKHKEKKKEKSGVYNILLIGVDRRDRSWNGNSDAMILCSINYDKQKVTLTSLMRDTCANIPGVGIRKMNAAFALGGAPLLCSTVEQNFLVSIDNYAWVDFEDMVQIIDILGGVDLQLNPQEAAWIGISIGAAQVVHLNGSQALGYARDRFSSGASDFTRTQRQRNVIMAIVNKAKTGSIGDLMSVANNVLPCITHNVDETKLLSLLKNLPTISKFTFVEQRVPYDGMFYYQGEMLVPDYAGTIDRMWEAIN